MRLLTLICLMICLSSYAKTKDKDYCSLYLLDKSGERPPFFEEVWELDDNKPALRDKRLSSHFSVPIIETDENKKIKIIRKSVSIFDKYIWELQKFVEFQYDDQNRLNILTIRTGEKDKQEKSDKKTVIKLDYANGKCYPLEEIISTNDDLEKKTIFNAKLCYELKTYFEKNPKALECQCGNDITNKILRDMLAGHQIQLPKLKDESVIKVDTKMKVFERVEVELLKKIPALSKPVLVALNKLNECKNIHGVGDALMDLEMWKVNETQPVKDLQKGGEVKGK